MSAVVATYVSRILCVVPEEVAPAGFAITCPLLVRGMTLPVRVIEIILYMRLAQITPVL